jgi:hypothetical protein
MIRISSVHIFQHVPDRYDGCTRNSYLATAIAFFFFLVGFVVTSFPELLLRHFRMLCSLKGVLYITELRDNDVKFDILDLCVVWVGKVKGKLTLLPLA